MSNAQDDLDLDSLRYSYMYVGQYPAIGSWHFLVKKYVLRGTDDEKAQRDVFPAKTMWAQSDQPKRFR